eukprot:snap_masked-scaffold_8-processed-gene-11.20-mRNA-1 protein AED:1.00 eAED:1.00 QI:0/0/0/0/1/1/2/0/63
MDGELSESINKKSIGKIFINELSNKSNPIPIYNLYAMHASFHSNCFLQFVPNKRLNRKCGPYD